MKNVEFYKCSNLSLCTIATCYRKQDSCDTKHCVKCSKETTEWLNEEYVTDWSRVTPFVTVRVKDKNDNYWYPGFYFIAYHKVNDIEYYVVSNTPNVNSAGQSFSIYDCCRLASEFND